MMNNHALQRVAVGIVSIGFAVVFHPDQALDGGHAVVFFAYPVAILAIALCVAVILDIGLRFATPPPAPRAPSRLPPTRGNDILTSLPSELFSQLTARLHTPHLLSLASTCRWIDRLVDWREIFRQRWGHQLRTDSHTTIVVARGELNGLARQLQVPS